MVRLPTGSWIILQPSKLPLLSYPSGRMPSMAEGTSTAFRYQDARGRGATRGRIQGAVERGRIMRLGRGVYATSTERIDQIAAAVLRLGGDAVASHETAAELWGIPILGRAPPSIQLPGIPA